MQPRPRPARTRDVPADGDHGSRSPRGEGGSVTVFFAVAVVAMLVLVGLVVDGGAKARALARADRLAAEAARAGGQGIDVPAAIGGGQPRLDVAAAARAARSYLRSRGVTGSATPTPDRRGITVTVTVTEPTVFLALAGVREFTVYGTAQATLVHGVTDAPR